MELADPPQDDLLEIVSTPNYSDPGESSFTLRARYNLPAGTTLLKETPAVYVPLLTFKCPPATVNREEVENSTGAKNAYFKAGWPHVNPILDGFENRNQLQLTAMLILRQPALAKSMVTPLAKGGYCSDRPKVQDTSADAMTFEAFRAVMHTLAFYGVRRSLLDPWLKFEECARLYEAVCANALYCATLVTQNRFAVGLYPMSARTNHSCRPNCIRVGTPGGMYTISTQPVKKGDEITVSYIRHIPDFSDHLFVRSKLKTQCGFDCVCEHCRGLAIRLGMTVDPQDKLKVLDNPYTARMTELIRQHPELDDELSAISAGVREGNHTDIITVCERVRLKYGELLESEPSLAYIISRHYVKLLQPAEDSPLELAQFSYEYWANLYHTSILDATDSMSGNSFYAVWGQFYRTLFKVFLANMAMQAAYRVPKDAPSREQVESEVLQTVHDLVTSMVELRQLCRQVLGSHWFLWTEFSMFSGIDIFLNHLEPQILRLEHSKVDLEKLHDKVSQLTGELIENDTEWQDCLNILQRQVIAAEN